MLVVCVCLCWLFVVWLFACCLLFVCVCLCCLFGVCVGVVLVWLLGVCMCVICLLLLMCVCVVDYKQGIAKYATNLRSVETLCGYGVHSSWSFAMPESTRAPHAPHHIQECRSRVV